MNAATETSESFAAPATAPRPVRPFYWSVRRELWENRSLFIAPLVAGGIAIVALILNAMHLDEGMQMLSALDPDRQRAIVTGIYAGIAFLITWVMAITGFFYLLDALHGERKDRSVLFWKSMPVSDTTTVLSKLFTALAVAPAIVIAVTIVTQARRAAARQRDSDDRRREPGRRSGATCSCSSSRSRSSTARLRSRSGMHRWPRGCCSSRRGRSASRSCGRCSRRLQSCCSSASPSARATCRTCSRIACATD